MATRPVEAPDEPKPLLTRLFEAAAAIMGMDEGLQTLELHFDNGHLRRWTRTDRQNGQNQLREFDARAPILVELLQARPRSPG